MDQRLKFIALIVCLNFGQYCFACETDQTDFQSITDMCNQTHQTGAGNEFC